MTPEQHRRVRELFDEACDLDDPSRIDEFLTERSADDAVVLGKVRALIERDLHATLDLDTPAAGSGFAVSRITPVDAPMPERIARYRVLSLIGEGGMGRVFRAEQDAPRRTVALKILRPGMVSAKLLRRFELEAELLGRLQHPGIAQIHEAGTFDDGSGAQPFFAMEFVEGRTLTTYADEERLDVRERLSLLADIAEAAHHAHQRGVLHRDLKPDNVLVDASGRCRILDFGIARVVDVDAQRTVQTEAGQIIGTLAYMSPEQVDTTQGDDLDSRVDQYALGVIGYELLAGRLPFDHSTQSIAQSVRVIAEVDPPKLGTIDRALSGDIETIIARAMAKDRDLRYPSASEFAADIRRFLADEPIVARPPSTIYQLRKLARRHRVASAGIVLAVVALVGGIIATSLMLRRAIDAEANAQREKTQAEIEAERANAVADFVRDIFVHADPIEGAGHDARVVDVLEAATEDLESSFEDQPYVKAELHSLLGMTYREIGLLEPARAHLEQSVALRRAQAVDLETRTALVRALNSLAVLYRQSDELEPAIGLYEETIAIHEALGTLETKDGSTVANNLAQALWHADRPEEADVAFKRSMALHREALEPDDPGLAICLSTYASTLGPRHRWSEAELLHREACDILRVRLGADHPFAAFSAAGLGECLTALGRHEEAIPLLRDAHAVVARAYGADHLFASSVAFHLSHALLESSAFAEAETMLRPVIEIGIREQGAAAGRVVRGRTMLARALIALDRGAEATEMLAAQADLLDAEPEADPWHVTETAVLLAISCGDREAITRSAEGIEELALPNLVHLQSLTFLFEHIAGLHEATGHAEIARQWRLRIPSE